MFEKLLRAEHLQAIALVALESSAFEHSLERVISGMLESRATGELLLHRKLFDAKVSVFKKLVEERLDGKITDDFHFLYNELTPLIQKRNDIVHGQWTLRAWTKYKKEGPDEYEPLAIRGNRQPTLASEARKVANLFQLNGQYLWMLASEHHFLKNYLLAALLNKTVPQLRAAIQARHKEP